MNVTTNDELAAAARQQVDQLMSACIGVMLDGGKPSESGWVREAKARLLESIAALHQRAS